MAQYFVQLNAAARTKMFNHWQEPQRFIDYLESNGVTLSGGVSLMYARVEEDGDFVDAPFAMIDATADPTTTAQAYSWGYIAGAQTVDDDFNFVMAVVNDPGGATTGECANAIAGMARLLGIAPPS